MSSRQIAGRCYRRGSAAARVALWALVLTLMALLMPEKRATADPGHHAGLVVTYASGSSVTRCVYFPGDQINGLELLQLSGLPLVASEAGAVCKIGDVGCDNPQDCFCQCHGSPCLYWAYYHLGEDGAWHYSNLGAAQYYLGHGDVDGWAWGSGGVGGGSLPDLYTFNEICGGAAVGGIAEAPPFPPNVPSEGNAVGRGEVFLVVAAAVLLLGVIAARRIWKRWV